jgi:DNA (cytosine-5)-methyltransferase 1
VKDGIAVIDLFAGPGGLAEGFSSVAGETNRAFDIRLSIEKDPAARRTLKLRAFLRQFNLGEFPDEYYEFLGDPTEVKLELLYKNNSAKAEVAEKEAWLQELGPANREVISARISEVLSDGEPWVLIGGPPCQAYSLVGRSRMAGDKDSEFAKDPRHTLYKEYLHILSAHRPDVFVMENVKGLLSSKLDDGLVFRQIVKDLENPGEALPSGVGPVEYRLFSLSQAPATKNLEEPSTGSEYIVRCEEYGIPQARHRVIIFGIRADRLAALPDFAPKLLSRQAARVTVKDALKDLPKLRSGLSKTEDSEDLWKEVLAKACKAPWAAEVEPLVLEKLKQLAKNLPRAVSRGAEAVAPAFEVAASSFAQGLSDPRMRKVVNHSTRSHIRADIERYLFASVFASVHSRSPRLADFPKKLLPKHENVEKAVSGKMFSDRFRVQERDLPSTTVTSHISKDGHYFIHYDHRQARSLTVREAARLQTFPDNYLFVGARTDQYRQVGNAVPPLLARQIAIVVQDSLVRLGQKSVRVRKASNG